MRSYFSAALAATAIALPTSTIAGSGDFAAGLVGGIIGSAIANQSRQQPRRTAPRTTTVRRSTSSGISNTQRQQNREVQTALNYFGFDAGGADGVLGRRSRAAVSSMEAFLSIPVDGSLTSFERDILLSAHNRAISGNPDTVRLISTSPLGARAALKAQHDLMTGNTSTAGLRTTGYPGLPLEVSRAVDEIAASSDPSAEQLLQRAGFVQLADMNGDGTNDYILDTSFSGSSFWCSAAQCKTMVFVSTPQGYARNDMLAHSPTPASFSCFGDACRLAEQAGVTVASTAPTTVPQAEAPATTMVSSAPVLPTFGATPVTEATLSSHCGKVNLLTASRGGFTTVADGDDPAVALAEQFCLARNFAVDSGEQMVAAMPGTTTEMVQAQCASFGPAMAAQLAAVSAKPEAEVMQDVASFMLDTGMSPDQLRTTATLCLSAGYATDNMDVALGSAMLMVALGSAPHAELVGHHLDGGFGAAKRPDLARDWYGTAVDALRGGAEPVFGVNQAGRTDLLVWAAMGEADAAGVVTRNVVPTAASLPTFALPTNN